jgi:acetylornithine/succinyldiaminopimelate/putrescine aminotransferase
MDRGLLAVGKKEARIMNDSRPGGLHQTLEFESYEALTALFRKHMAPGKLAYYERVGLLFVMGERGGIWFSDAFTGRRFINCHSNGGVFNLGHANPRVTRALSDALGKLDIGNHHFVSGPRARLAERLSGTTSGLLERVVFGVSGGEAIDLALKLARAATGRRKIVSAVGGYHGHTGLSVATGDPGYRDWFGPNLPGFVQVPFNDARALEGALDDDTAAVILEAIPATLGMPMPLPGYFTEVRRLCDERGVKLIIDEVQTGLGRTGKWWSYQHDDVAPDAIVSGKGLSGGLYPITATLLRADLHDAMDTLSDPLVHISTFGGAELGCVAALEVLDIVSEPGFLERVTRQGELLAQRFEGLPFELRRRGLFAGLAFPTDDAAFGGIMRLMMQEIFAFPAGNDRRVLQFLPPLIMSDAEAEDLAERVQRAFS